MDQESTVIYVMLDNMAAVRALQFWNTTTSTWRVKKFQKLKDKASVLVEVNLIPGYKEIQGNVVADQLARYASDSNRNNGQVDINISRPLSLATIKR